MMLADEQYPTDAPSSERALALPLLQRKKEGSTATSCSRWKMKTTAPSSTSWFGSPFSISSSKAAAKPTPTESLFFDRDTNSDVVPTASFPRPPPATAFNHCPFDLLLEEEQKAAPLLSLEMNHLPQEEDVEVQEPCLDDDRALEAELLCLFSKGDEEYFGDQLHHSGEERKYSYSLTVASAAVAMVVCCYVIANVVFSDKEEGSDPSSYVGAAKFLLHFVP